MLYKNSKEAIDNTHLLSTYYEPTLSPFKNALLITNKKVGSRFMGDISSMPKYYGLNKLQIDLYFNNNPLLSEKNKTINKDDNTIQTITGTKYVYTSFDIWKNELSTWDESNGPNTIVFDKFDGYNHYKTTADFLKYQQVDSMQELLFENPHKDIVLVMRNPIRRFVSGCVQLLFPIIDNLPTDILTREELKYYAGVGDKELKNIYKFFNQNNIQSNGGSLGELDDRILSKILKYLVEKRTELVLQDIHTTNYLHNVKELIYNIKDKNRIKIINLDECKSIKGYKFFDDLRGDTLVSDYYTNKNNSTQIHKDTNTQLYDFFITSYLNSSDFHATTMRFYLEPEFNIFYELQNSPYFVKLGE